MCYNGRENSGNWGVGSPCMHVKKEKDVKERRRQVCNQKTNMDFEIRANNSVRGRLQTLRLPPSPGFVSRP
jgi:hypothetical protein